MVFSYINDFSGKIGKVEIKTINVDLLPRNLDKVKKEFNYNLGDVIDFKDSILNDSTLKINSFEINKSYKLDYNVCTKECYVMNEYVRPSLYNNYDKAVMKFNNEITGKYDLYELLSTYGYVIYDNHIDNSLIKQVIPIKVKEKNIDYVEVINDALVADKITIKLKVRDVIYNYNVK